MKKSGLIMICLALILTCLTGCVTEETRETILSEMQKEDIIKGDWENIGQDTGDAGPIPDISLYNYYYEDADENWTALVENGTWESTGTEKTVISWGSTPSLVNSSIHASCWARPISSLKRARTIPMCRPSPFKSGSTK